MLYVAEVIGHPTVSLSIALMSPEIQLSCTTSELIPGNTQRDVCDLKLCYLGGFTAYFSIRGAGYQVL